MRSRLPAGAAIFAVFFLESSVLGHWIPRIPDVKARLALDDAGLGLALLCLPLGTLAGLALAGRVIGRTGLAGACRIFLPAWALLFVGPALAPSLAALCAALALVGLAVGMIETAMNTEAARQESASGRRLMSRCHGFWSLGSMVGALVGAALAERGVGTGAHFLIAMPLIAGLGYLAAAALPMPPQAEVAAAAAAQDGARPVAVAPVGVAPGAVAPDIAAADAPAGDEGPLFRWPARRILPLCLMPLGLMMVEGAFIDWSAVFAREVLDASPLAIGVVYAAFSLVMAATRLSGDALADRFGDVAIVRVSALAATLGIAGFALAPNVASAFAFASLAGAGVAIVYPLAVTAVAARPGRSPTDNVAAMNMVSFSAFLLAPPLIGFLSEATSLRVALGALVPFALTTLALSAEVRPRAPAPVAPRDPARPAGPAGGRPPGTDRAPARRSFNDR